jgi:hypothetical protein
MRTWRHSHNLTQTTRDRLDGLVHELEAERAHLEAQAGARSPNDQAKLQRVDKALSLLEQALVALTG